MIMSALDTLMNILSHQTLIDADLRYCLVANDKKPYKLDGNLASPSCKDDFVRLDEFDNILDKMDNYAGIGISIQASNICAIDVDHCFSTAFDVNSGDDRALNIIEMFKDDAYIEFNFSGLGLRILFKQDEVEDYTTKYYIKNEKNHIEYYQPRNSNRYVTLTGQTIVDNDIDARYSFFDKIVEFLEKYMKRSAVYVRDLKESAEDDRPLEELMKRVKTLYLKNYIFQNVWFDEVHALDHGMSKESDKDFHLMALLYENVTQNRDKLRLVFEQSPYYKSKDTKHKSKWTRSEYRYFNFQFDKLTGRR